MNLTKEQKLTLLVTILIFGGALFIGILQKIGFLQKSFETNVNNPASNKQEQKPKQVDKTDDINYFDYDLEISIKEMSEVYYNNELNGNKNFFGKLIKTKAKFDETSSGMFSRLTAYFKGIDSIYNIHCTSFENDTKEKLSTFSRGEIVNIIGTVDELVSSSIKFKDCKIYK